MADSVKCEKCQTTLPPDFAFCPRCGTGTGTHPVESATSIDGEGDLPPVLAAQYVLERELGQGGMAVVYLAHDRKHDRKVALKLIRPDLSASLARDRFLREIRIAAKLAHPNILPLYDSGEADGRLYYVMPYVEGESLRDLLDRESQLPIPELIRIGREVADALAHAHSLGIVHRDIKPENILLEAGHAVVSDFGIAKAVSESGGERLTQTGMAVGTPAYMSPEQVSGGEQHDGRCDIYSLGCVLFEMAVGEVPFTGPTAHAIMARHSMEAVPRPRVVRASIPEELERVILCALEKVPADRFHTAAQLTEALDAVATGQTPSLNGVSYRPLRGARARRPRVVAAVAGIVVVSAVLGAWMLWPDTPSGSPAAGLDTRRLAVLYFDDRSEDGTLAHVADGLTEELITHLSRIRTLDVVSVNGVAPYRGESVALDSVARALEVGTIVRGELEPIDDRMRIAVHLVDGPSGVDYARESVELPISDVLGAQDSVAEEVTRMLRERLGEEIRLRERRASTLEPDAWTLLQRAERRRKSAEDLLAEGDLDASMAAFEAGDSLLALSEQVDASWIDPIVLRSRIAYRQARLASSVPEALERIAIGMGHAERALARDDENAAALELRGTLQYFHWILGTTADPDSADALLQAAKRDLEAAIAIDPTLASAHSTLSHLYYQTEDVVSALVAARRAYEEDAYLAVAPEVLWRLFLGNYDLEHPTQATRWCEVGSRRFPDDFRFTECHLWVMTTPIAEPDVDEAWQLLGQLSELAPEPVRELQAHRGQMIVGGVIGRAGLSDSAARVLDAARAGADVDPNLELSFIEAYMRILAGDPEEAVALLRRYFAANPPDDPEQETGWETHWWWREIREYPDFPAVTAGG